MKLYFQKKVVLGFILTLTIIAALGIYAYRSTQRLIDTARLLTHATRVINNAEQLLVISISLETGYQGYVITGNEAYLEPYDSAVRKIRRHIDLLLTNTQEDSQQNSRIRKLDTLVRNYAEHARRVINIRQGSFGDAQALIIKGEGKKMMDEIRRIIHETQEKERQIFREQNTITGQSLVRFQASFVGLLVAPALIIVVLFYSINRNFNARDKAEKQLIKAASEIQHLNKELEAYTYSVSHDLRAPLRSIDGYSQILREDYGEKLDDEGRRVIQVIVSNARRMGQLIDDLLDFSRIGRKELIKTDLDIREIVETVIGELTDRRKAPNVEIRILALEPGKGDVSMLRQVWTNLISNAIKYSGKRNPAHIEIGSYAEDEATCYYVKDNGVGFNMEYKDKLFGVFQRLHKADEFEGTGVGLALVKRIVTRHGGTVWADARLNEGATFYFTLPR